MRMTKHNFLFTFIIKVSKNVENVNFLIYGVYFLNQNRSKNQ